MLKSEWKGLIKSKIFLVVMVAIIAIPTIYTTLFLGSMWDPYGNIDKLPVAVVNEDAAVTYEGLKLNVGEELEKNLKKNDSLDFRFMEKSEAEEGLKNGIYYMVVTIPQTFSKNASTLMDTKPEKMELQYETNPGTNYIASKMSETALQKIKESVAQEVTRTYAKTVFDQIAKVGAGMQEASDGAAQIADGTLELEDGNQTITENLNVLADSSLTFKEGSTALEVGLKTYTDGVTEVNAGTKELKAGTGDLTAGITSGKNGAERLASGTTALLAGTDSLNSGAFSLNSGISQLEKQVPALQNGVNELASGSGTLAAGTGSIKDGSTQLKSGMQDAVNGSAQVFTGAQSLKAGLGQLSDSSNSLKQGIQQMNEGLDQLIASVPQSTEMKLNLASQSEQGAAAAYQMDSVPVAGLEAELEEAVNTQNYDRVVQIAKQAVEAAKTNEAGIQEGNRQIGTMSELLREDAAALGQTADSQKGLDTFAQSLQAVREGGSRLEQGITSYTDTVAYIAEKSETLTAGASQVSEGTKKLNQGAADLEIGITAADSGANKLAQGTGVLQKKMPELVTGAGQLSDGAKQLSDGTQTLKNGTYTLNDGAVELASGMKTLLMGSEQLGLGTEKLSAGTERLVENNAMLLAGAGKLSDGAGQISSGAGKLADGSGQLSDGIGKLADGSGMLKSELADGAAQVTETKADDDNLDMFSAPVDSRETQITEVENNGHAMAPYMMSVALWVGCIAFCLMYPLMKYSGELKTGLRWWASKASVLMVIAVLQAVVMIGALHFMNGFTPVQMGKTVAVAILASVTFMAILYFFNVCIGKAGSFLMLIFMVVQLAGSAGTYPVELSGSFVAGIHKWLPFTYTVNAFRSTISGGQSIRETVIMLCILLVVFTALTIFVFRIRTRRIKAGKRVMNDILENMGLL